MHKPDVLEKLMATLSTLLQDQDEGSKLLEQKKKEVCL
jgi:hypothetical protein